MTKQPALQNPQQAAPATPAGSADAGYLRLHIAPLDPQLLKIIVPAAVLPNARRISYHTLQTFPERPFGFVELPVADAEKVKKRLNGAVIKGAKVRIERARPDNMPKPDPEAVLDPADVAKSNRTKAERKDRKRKRSDHPEQEMAGVELENGRKVKRGWTVTPEEAVAKKKKEKEEDRKHRKNKNKDDKNDKKDKKKKKRKDPESKYSDKAECLVKTRLPPNKLDMVDHIAEGEKKSKKGKKKEVVVHEFEKSTKFGTFLKTSQPSTIAASVAGEATYVEGKGWVQEDGTVLEEVKSTRPTTVPKLQVPTKKLSHHSAAYDDDTTSSSGSSSDGEEQEDDEDDIFRHPPSSTEPLKTAPPPPLTSVMDNAAPADPTNEPDTPSRPKSASSARSLSIRIPPTTPTPSSAKVHPLEALYKRQQQQQEGRDEETANDSEPFAFFGSREVEEGEDEEMAGSQDGNEEDHLIPSQESQSQMPMTPFSKQDFEWRRTRSAAPTPDTAHPSRISRIWYPHEDGEDVLGNVEEDQAEDDDGHEHMSMGGVREADDEDGAPATNPNTDFEKWFWENRGDLNRSWKKRRKVAAKEKRYRENRARADRAI